MMYSFPIAGLAKEHNLYRCFDSLAFEDEETNTFESGVRFSGDLSQEQTRDIMPLISSFAQTKKITSLVYTYKLKS